MGENPLLWFLPYGEPNPENALDYNANIPVVGIIEGDGAYEYRGAEIGDINESSSDVDEVYQGGAVNQASESDT